MQGSDIAPCLSFEEGLDLFKNAPLDALGQMAMRMRFNKNPRKQITFILDSNPNYTNICNYVELVKTARERYPGIHPHFFSAPEIWNCAKVSQITVEEALREL